MEAELVRRYTSRRQFELDARRRVRQGYVIVALDGQRLTQAIGTSTLPTLFRTTDGVTAGGRIYLSETLVVTYQRDEHLEIAEPIEQGTRQGITWTVRLATVIAACVLLLLIAVMVAMLVW